MGVVTGVVSGRCELINDRAERVIVWLGDLGQSLTEAERLHWQHYNIIPEGGISRTSYLRNIQGMFADPECRT
jgi:hypothetical protein